MVRKQKTAQYTDALKFKSKVSRESNFKASFHLPI